MKRRELLELGGSCLSVSAALSSAPVFSGVVGAGLVAGCESQSGPAVSEQRAPAWAHLLFTREQALTLEDLAELIIPEGATPGAKSAGVPAFIENVVRAVYADTEQIAFCAGLDGVRARARARYHREFWQCSSSEQTAIVMELVQAAGDVAQSAVAAFVRALRELTIRGYCGSKLGATRTLAYEPTPGEYQGCLPLAAVGKASATW